MSDGNGMATTPLELLDSAGNHLTRSVPMAGPDARVDEVIRSMIGTRFDSAVDVAVVEGDRLLGLVPIEVLLAAPSAAEVRTIMDDTPPVVGPGVDQEQAAWQMVRQDEGSLAVVDGGGRFLGLIRPQRMLAVLLEEHEEDMSRLAGVLHQADRVRAATEEPVLRRFWHRVPWLLVGFLGALVAAVLVGAFEEDIQRNVLVASFLPGVIYIADAVGTQTEAVVIRGLSVGVSIRRVVRRELLTGLTLGVALGGLFVPVGLLVWGEGDVVLAVALALFAACSVATAVAMLLPVAMTRFAVDPAFGSGPLATVLQDLLSIVVYFLMVAALVD
jgi:magnesium transporter